MAIFEKEDKKIFFIHIPKTAGRHICGLFKQNNFEISFCEFSDNIMGYEVPHLFYPLYDILPIHDCIHFSIIRNPLERFKSCAKFFIWKYNLSDDYFFDPNITFYDLNDFLGKEIENKSSYWVPQNKFITKKTLLWKYESLFNDEFLSWVENNMKVHLIDDKNKIKYPKREFDFITPKFSKNLEKFVKKYYEEDYDVFGYDYDLT